MSIEQADRMPVLRFLPDELPESVIVVGDPDRAERIADRLEQPEQIGRYREYVTYRGLHRGSPVAVASHGVGAGGAGICFEELCRAGAKRLIRVGTAGGMQTSVRDGHLVIVNGAIRDDGFTDRLVPIGYPALASHRLTGALRSAASSCDVTVHEGLALTSAVMYPHEVLGSNLEMWQRAGALAVEQECASLFVLAGLHQVEAAAILTIDGNPLADENVDMADYDPHRSSITEAVDKAVGIALDAVTSAGSLEQRQMEMD